MWIKNSLQKRGIIVLILLLLLKEQHSCLANCQICQGFVTCTECLPGYTLANNECTLGSVACGALCSSCDVADTCLQCQPNSVNLGNGDCQCELTYVEDTDQCVLRDCSALYQCSTCSTTECLTCNSGYTVNSGNCSLDCTVYHSECLTCSNTDCLTCNSGYTLNSGSCSLDCSIYHSECLTCSNTECLSCSSGYTVNSGSCILDCTVYHSECLTCNSSQCTSCNSGYTLNGNICNFDCTTYHTECFTCSQTACLTCSSGFSLDPATNSCEDCSVYGNCVSCSASSCIQCSQGFTLCSENCVVIPEIDLLLNSTYKHYSSAFNPGIDTLKILNSIPQARLFLKVFTSLFSLFDDYWYYFYHERSYMKLEITLIFFQMQVEINSERLVPHYMNMTAVTTAVQPHFPSAQSYLPFTRHSYQIFEGTQTYFVKSTRPMYFENFLIAIIVFGVSLIFSALLKKTVKKLREKKDSFYCLVRWLIILFRYFNEKSMFKALFAALIEQNLIFIAFHCGAQMRIPFSLSAFDKINLILCICYLFIVVIFATAFYVLIQWYQRGRAEVFLKLTLPHWQSYIIETFLTGVCGFMGFIHGYFLQDYLYQMILLALLRVFICLAIFFLRKTFLKFCNKAIWLITFCYYITGIIFDTFLMITDQFGDNCTWLPQQHYFYYQISIICSLVFFAVLGFIVTTTNQILQLKDSLIRSCKRKGVSPKPAEKSSFNKEIMEHVSLDKRLLKKPQMKFIDRSRFENIEFEQQKPMINKATENKFPLSKVAKNMIQINKITDDKIQITYSKDSVINRNKRLNLAPRGKKASKL